MYIRDQHAWFTRKQGTAHPASFTTFTVPFSVPITCSEHVGTGVSCIHHSHRMQLTSMVEKLRDICANAGHYKCLWKNAPNCTKCSKKVFKSVRIPDLTLDSCTASSNCMELTPSTTIWQTLFAFSHFVQFWTNWTVQGERTKKLKRPSGQIVLNSFRNNCAKFHASFTKCAIFLKTVVYRGH